MSKWAPKSLAVLIILLFGAGSVRAQEHCTSLIALSKTVSTKTEDRRSIEEHAASFCSDYKRYKTSGSSSHFGGSYKFLSASMGKSSASVDEVATSFCSASQDYSARADAYDEYIETIAPQAFPAYEACLRESNNQGQKLLFSLNLGSLLPNEFSLNISFNSNVQGQTAVLASSSSSDVACVWHDGTNARISIPSGSTAILKCSRPDITKPSYATVTNINVAPTGAVANNTISIPWQAYDRSGVPVNALQELRKEVAQARQSLSARGVGEIVASMLSVAQFQRDYNVNGEVWELAKGQDAPAGSRYSAEFGPKLPDLRGVFLRGKNHDRDAATGNPEGELNPGDPQKDEVASHTHGLSQLDIGAGEDDGKSDNVRARYRNNVQETTDAYGGKETRPRNVTVNYFIRVN